MKYYFLFSTLIVITIVFTFAYYRRFNVSIKNDEKKLYKLSPSKFALFALLFTLLIGYSFSMYDNNVLRKERLLLEDHLVRNIYLEEGVLSGNQKYILEEYNLYFGGTYSQNDIIVICIREDAPIALIDYLNSNNVPYALVKHNYSDLLSLKQLIIVESKDLDVIIGVGINEMTNKVTITALDENAVKSVYQNYIDEDMLEVKESEGIVEH